MRYVMPFVTPEIPVPQCIDSTGNTDDEQDDVPRGGEQLSWHLGDSDDIANHLLTDSFCLITCLALNEPCLEDGTCLNGNLCDPLPEDANICKSPMGGNCLELSDCSSTINDDRLECTLEGGTNQNRICAIPAPAAEPPAPSQDAARKKRNAAKARWLKRAKEECPGNAMACPISAGNSFECVNVSEEVSFVLFVVPHNPDKL